MFASNLARTLLLSTAALLLSGCSTLGTKPTTANVKPPQVGTAGADAALDADIQRILAAGGIDAAPISASPIASAPVTAPAVPSTATSTVTSPPSVAGGATRPVSVAQAPDAAARLDLSALPSDIETTDPIVSTTATYDFNSVATRPQTSSLMLPPVVPGGPNPSVSAGILPSIPITTVETAVTGDGAKPVVRSPRAVRPVSPIPIPPEIQAIRQAGVSGSSSSSREPAPSTNSMTSTGTVPSPALPTTQSVNTDRPLAPIKRF